MARPDLSLAHLSRGAADDVTNASGHNAGTAIRNPAAMPLVGYIRNPKSHRNKGNASLIGDHARVITVQPQTRPELEEALADFARQGIGILAISGGDGTIRDVLTRGAPLFGDNWPEIIILPQGKTNALALDLGISRRWHLREALDAAGNGRAVIRRPLLLTPTDGDQRSRLGFFLGVGAFNVAIDTGQVAHRYGAFQGFAVAMTAAFGILQALVGLGNGPWRSLSRMRIVNSDSGEPLAHSGVCPEDSRYIGGITTLRTFPPGIQPFSKMECSGPIGYFLLDAPLRRVAALAPFAGLGWQHPILPKLGIHRGSSNEFSIELEDPLILDGERYPAGSYRISAGPELRFITP